jgi:hypothetical protein
MFSTIYWLKEDVKSDAIAVKEVGRERSLRMPDRLGLFTNESHFPRIST